MGFKSTGQKGYASKAFVWDTLEIETLLNPCRYSYALHTKHMAQEDTELVDHLFWNQLYRLSQNETQCFELKELLPAKINSILKILRQPIYSDFSNRHPAVRIVFTKHWWIQMNA